MSLPALPVQSLTSIAFEAEAQDNGDFTLFGGQGDSAAYLIPDGHWPYCDSITVRFVAGYAANAIPASILHGLKLRLGDHYQFRQSADMRNIREVPGRTWMDVLWPYRWN